MTDNQPPLQTDPAYQGGELSFAEIVAFFQRHWRLIFGTAFAAALITCLVVILFVPHGYEAATTLIIVPPKFASDLKPATLTVQGYQQLLESDAVIAEARKRLIARGVLRPKDVLRLGWEIDTKIFASRRAEETVLAPMLQSIARSDSPEKAAEIANTWANVFLERTSDLITGTTSSSVKFIDQQYPQVLDSLVKIEDERANLADGYQKRYDDVAASWDDKVSALKNETTSLLAAQQAETRRLIEEFRGQHNLESRRAQLTALRTAFSALQGEQAGVASQLQLKQLQLDAARRQLAQTQQLLTLQKAITDDSLWRAQAEGANGGAKTDWTALQDRSLRSQEVNPVYTSLSEKTANIEMEVNSLIPRAAGLTADLERLNTEMKKAEASLGSDEAALDKLQRERAAGLAQLQEDRENMLTHLTHERQAALDAIKRETDTRLGQADRMISQERDLFAELAKNYNQARLAKGEQNMEDIRLGAPAVPPETSRVSWWRKEGPPRSDPGRHAWPVRCPRPRSRREVGMILFRSRRHNLTTPLPPVATGCGRGFSPVGWVAPFPGPCWWPHFS